MGKKSLTKSTTKKKSTKKGGKKKAVSASAKKTTQKKPTLKTLRKKQFEAWTPETLYQPEADTAYEENFTAPPAVEAKGKAAKQVREILSRQFDLNAEKPKKAAPKKTAAKKTETKKTEKKAPKKETKKAAPAAKKADQKKETAKAPKKAAAKKAVSTKDLIALKFDAWQPEKPYAPAADTEYEKNFAAPSAFDSVDKSLLLKQFDISAAETPAVEAAPAPKEEAKAPAPEPVEPAPKKEPVPIETLIKLQFDSWAPEKPYAPAPDADFEKNFAAPAAVEGIDPGLLLKQFDLSVPDTPAEEKPAEAAAPEPEEAPSAAPAEEVTPEPEAVEETAEAAPAEPEPVAEAPAVEEQPAEPETPAEPVAEEKPEEAPAAAVEEPAAPPAEEPVAEEAPATLTETAPEPAEPVTPEPEKAEAAEAPVEKTVKKAAEAPKTVEKPAAPEKAAAEPEAEKAAPEPPEPPKEDLPDWGKFYGDGDGGKPPMPPMPPTNQQPPMGSGLKLLIASLGVIFALIIAASISNMQDFFVKTTDDAVEIWRGDFSPRGTHLVVELPGAKAPAVQKDIYTRNEALSLAFQYYMDKADALTQVEGDTVDFGAIRRYLKKAGKYTTTDVQEKLVSQSLDRIDYMMLMFKAAVAAEKQTKSGYDNALDYLEQAKALDLTADEATRVTNQIQELRAAKESLKAEQKPAAQPAPAAGEKAAAESSENGHAAKPEAVENAGEPEAGATDEGGKTGIAEEKTAGDQTGFIKKPDTKRAEESKETAEPEGTSAPSKPEIKDEAPSAEEKPATEAAPSHH